MISIHFCHESSHTSWLRWELHRDKDLCIATTFTELMFPLQIKLLWSNTFCFNLLLLFFASNWVSLSSFASNTVTNHFFCCMNLIWPVSCFYCSKVIRCCPFSGWLKLIHPCHSSDLILELKKIYCSYFFIVLKLFFEKIITVSFYCTEVIRCSYFFPAAGFENLKLPAQFFL